VPVGSTSQRWERFWAGKTTPLNRDESDEHYSRYGAELRMLFDGEAPRRVLELGCGSGSLFPYLAFDRAERYVGVDFSQTMLDVFAAARPGVELMCARAEEVRLDESFDLIFSSAVAQFMSREQLAQHISNSAAMLAPGGLLVLGANPWRRLRWAYSRGDLTGGPRRSLLASVPYYLRRFWHDPMGYWHDTTTIDAHAAAHGLRASYHGSFLYPYRFHAVLRR
jgi:cyclopropane fatty-acyl-phospholipid synthase-like methyltransferase